MLESKGFSVHILVKEGGESNDSLKSNNVKVHLMEGHKMGEQLYIKLHT